MLIPELEVIFVLPQQLFLRELVGCISMCRGIYGTYLEYKT